MQVNDHPNERLTQPTTQQPTIPTHCASRPQLRNPQHNRNGSQKGPHHSFPRGHPSQRNQSHNRRPLLRRPTHSLRQQTRLQHQRPSAQRTRFAGDWRGHLEQVRRRDAAAREAARCFPRLLDRRGRVAVCVLRDCWQLCEYTCLSICGGG